MNWFVPVVAFYLVACSAGENEHEVTSFDGTRGFRSFSLSSEAAIDSLSRGMDLPTDLRKRLKGSIAFADSGEHYGGFAPAVRLLGAQGSAQGASYLLLRDIRNAGMDGSIAEVVLVEVLKDGQLGSQILLCKYAMYADHQETCAVEWAAPLLRGKGRAQWVGEQDSAGVMHLEIRKTLTEVMLAEQAKVLKQDTLMSTVAAD